MLWKDLSIAAAIGALAASVGCDGARPSAQTDEASATGVSTHVDGASVDGAPLTFAVLNLTQRLLRDPDHPSSRAFRSFAAMWFTKNAYGLTMPDGSRRYVFEGTTGERPPSVTAALTIFQAPPSPGAEGFVALFEATLEERPPASAPQVAESDRHAIHVLLQAADEAAGTKGSPLATELARYASESVIPRTFTARPIPGGTRFVFRGTHVEDGDVAIGTVTMTLEQHLNPDAFASYTAETVFGPLGDAEDAED